MIARLACKYAYLAVKEPAVEALVITRVVMLRIGLPLGHIHLYGRVEQHFQHVAARLEQALHSHSPAPEHIVGAEHFLSVQLNFGVGIQAIEAQVYVAALQK